MCTAVMPVMFPRGTSSQALATLAIAGIYFVAAQLGLRAALTAGQVTLVWPPSGIALAALLVLGYRFWPGVALGALAVNALAGEPLLTACGIAAGNTLEALAGAWLLRRVAGFQNPLCRLRDVLALVALAAFLSTSISATVGVTSLCVGGVQPWSLYGLLWREWWVGDALGDLVVAPVLLVWSGRSAFAWQPRRLLEGAVLGATLLAISLLVFWAPEAIAKRSLEYSVFPFVIWAAIRFGQRGTAPVVLAASAVSILGTLNGWGPFAQGPASQDLLMLQIFMGAVAITALLLSAAVSERNTAEESLRHGHFLLKAVTDGASDAVFLKDAAGRYLMMNPAGARLLGKSVEEVLGKDDRALLPPETARQIMEDDRRILAVGQHRTSEEAITAGGVTRTYLTTKGPFRDHQDRVIGVVGIARDITDRKRGEERLQAESTFRKAIENSVSSGIAAVDPEGRQTYVNPAFCRMVGYSEEELVGARPPFVYWPPEERPAIGAALEEVLKGAARPGGFQLRFQRKSGERFPVLVQVSVLDDSQGARKRWLASVSDLGEVSRLEEARRQSEERYRSLVLATSQVVWTTNAEGDVVEDLPTWRAFTGQSREEMMGHGWTEMVHPEDRERVSKTWAHSLATRTPHAVEFRVRARGGEYRHVLGRAVPMVGPDGSLREWVGALTDITDLKQAEDARGRLLELERSSRSAAEEAGRRSAFLAEAANIFSSSLDHEATLKKLASLAVPAIADYCSVGLPGEGGALRWLTVAHRDPARADLARRIAEGYSSGRDDPRGPQHVLRSGRAELYPDVSGSDLERAAASAEHLKLLRELAPCSTMIVPLTAHGQTPGVLAFTTAESRRRYDEADLVFAEDVGRRVALALENARLYREAQEANRLKDEFLAMLAHELRNPLAPILTAMGILRGKTADRDLSWIRDIVERQVRRMARLLDDLLDVSRITRGMIELKKERVDLADVVTHSLENTRDLIRERSHSLDVSLPPERLLLDADPVRLEQVLANLLQNAAKYTEPGGTISLRADRDGSHVSIEVLDSGRGIELDMLSRVFDLFVQSDRSLDRSQGGLGIGLTVVKKLVEMHGGTVEARSEGKGRGSAFIVRLPALPAAAAPAPGIGVPLPGPQVRPLRLLLVDDSADVVDSMAKLLESMGHQVRTAHDGEEAIAAAGGCQPEVVLLDIGLPGMDGYQLAERLRKIPGLERSFLVAISGYGQEGDRHRSHDAGFDLHLVKPVDLDTLRATLSSAGERSPPPATA